MFKDSSILIRMRRKGLEPSQANAYQNLNLARLPFRHFRVNNRYITTSFLKMQEENQKNYFFRSHHILITQNKSRYSKAFFVSPFLMASITKSFKNLSFLNPSLYCISVGMCSFILSHPFHIACSYLYYRDIFYQCKALLNYQSTFLVQNIFLFKIQI